MKRVPNQPNLRSIDREQCRGTVFLKFLAAGLLLAIWPSEAPRADPSRDTVSKCAAVIDGSAEAVVFNTQDNDGEPVPVRGVLSKPAGQGPFPAVVMLHRSLGVIPPNCYSTGRKTFHDLGYVVLLVDSDSVVHAGRGVNYSIGDYTSDHQARDAIKALAYLSGLDFVDSKRVALVGYAYGGTSALAVISRGRHGDGKIGEPFRAVAAWHPHCPTNLDNQRVPLMIIAGGNDTLNWPQQRCPDMVRTGPTASEYEYIVMPNLGHNFDAWWERNYNAEATADAYERLVAFFDKHL